jgi:hypothetical protein
MIRGGAAFDRHAGSIKRAPPYKSWSVLNGAPLPGAAPLPEAARERVA